MIIKNKLRDIKPVIMDSDHFPVIVSNVGVSSPNDDFAYELKKAEVAVNAGAGIISDLSLAENVSDIQKQYLEKVKTPFSIVSVYETYCNALKNTVTPELFIRNIEEQIMRGVDVITLHATVFKDDMIYLSNSKRLIPSTSRGGAMMLYCLQKYGFENPYYMYFEDILKIAKKYNVCLSLGPMYRPGSVWDCQAENELHLMELTRMSQLVKKAISMEVGIAIEGIGHAPLNLIPSLITTAKGLCKNVPYRVLTVSIDTAMGYDHIASAIASAMAVLNGADSITCVTRSEHLGFPTIDDVKESVICARIAAESGYSARKQDFSKDYLVSLARSKSGCYAECDEFMFMNQIRKCKSDEHKGKSCGMCGDFCPFLILDDLK